METLFKWAHDAGWKGNVQKTADAQFGDIVAKVQASDAPLQPSGEEAAPAPPPAPLPDLLVSSADFIGDFVSPEYLIDGMVQRRYFYSMTAQTGVGKTSIAMRWMAHVITARPIGDRE